MIFQRASLYLFMLIVYMVASTIAHSSNNCTRTCETSRSSVKKVPYPFGFSDSCLIPLNCTKTGTEIGGFQVQSITSDGLSIEFPARCYRSVESIKPLFGNNIAVAWRSNLLLQNCSNPLGGCFLTRSPLESKLNASNCNSTSDNLACFSKEGLEIDVMSYENVTGTRCKYVFSSLAVGSYRPVVSLELQRAELEWWLEGNCSRSPCHPNGFCKDVKRGNGKSGFRCWCNEGFVGDGYVDREGCNRTSLADSGCNVSKFVSAQCGGTKRVGALIVGIVAGASLIFGLVVLCYCVIKRSNSVRNQLNEKRLLCEAAGSSSIPFLTYKEIERATNGFAEKQRLGTGAYGTVYAGKLVNDKWVAIKKIRHTDMYSIEQVRNEIKLLSSVSHPNLVRLLAFCVEEDQPILVYEFMPNGTLCQHLQRERGQGLPWTIRLTIATETAKAITYLHSVMNPPIYHRDIKSSNILLDYNYRSKVADFGLSRLGMIESSYISTAPQGTPGYLDPQYHQYFHLSDKSDVYSFGVVLIEIITALKVVDFSRPQSEVNLAALAVDRIKRGRVDEIIDPQLEPHRDAWTLSSIHSVIELAFRCLAFHQDMRPTMMEVAEELENIRLSSWMPDMCMASPEASSCSSSERSLSVASVKKEAVGSRKVLVAPRMVDCISSMEVIKDSSPVSVQDPWSSEHSSPSTNSLLGKFSSVKLHDNGFPCCEY
ncbi:hypothetical protein K2173_006113 [Erythroxylum novogranatense]|uniref:Protein kinase domain-containing protein n=1 Tax=Erythroxylum novogranatense TaxID=1862640 RepID=A0AAV8TE37_9ROSI|nr:hypothetical protein K2173_006113 [Erythroxylum novogranatense]